MNLTEEEYTAFHESGHTLIAKLFDDILDFEFVTISRSKTIQYDDLSLGGTKVKPKIPTSEFLIYDHDKVILMSLSGLCTDDLIYNNYKLNKNFYRIPVWAKKFASKEYELDIKKAVAHFETIKNKINLNWQEYIIYSLRDLHNLLLQEPIRETLKNIKNDLLKLKTLMNEDVDRIIEHSSFIRWKEKNLLIILKERKKLLQINCLFRGVKKFMNRAYFNKEKL